MTKGSSKVAGFLIMLLICYLFLPTLVQGKGGKPKTYVVYDSPGRYGNNYPLVGALMEHLSHFELDCQAVPLEDWKPGTLADADLVVFVGLKDEVLPQGLLEEMRHAQRIIWFERNIGQLAAYLKWQDFQTAGAENGWSSYHYKKDMELFAWMNVVVTQPGSEAKILATVENAGDTKPLAWQRDNVYFCGLLEIEPVFMTTLGGLLSQFIPNNLLATHGALLRIEDVSPLTDPQAVRAVIATVGQYHIPYAIGVIAVGVDGDGNQVYMHDTPEMVNILKEAQDNGASIIMHGYTHQNQYSPKTGEGYEFWNARDDKPMENDEAFTAERIEAGIAELVRCGLIPVAFEPPHYAMSSTGYKVLSRYFNIYSGMIQVSDKGSESTLTLPYMAQSKYLNGMLLLPENMGYYYDDKNSRVQQMLQSSARILDVPGGFACFFYHGYLAPDKLPAIIEGLQKQGYEFVDLRQFPIKVESPQVRITGNNGNLTVDVDENLKASWKSTLLTSRLMEKAGTVHIAVLLLIVTVLILIIIKLRMNVSRHYEG